MSTPALHCADGHSLRVGTKYAPLVPRDQAHPGLSQGSGTARQDPREGGGGWASGSGPLLCPLWSRVWRVTCDPSTGACLPPTVALGFLEEEMEAVAPHVLSEPSDAAWCPIPVSLRNTGSEAPAVPQQVRAFPEGHVASLWLGHKGGGPSRAGPSLSVRQAQPRPLRLQQSRMVSGSGGPAHSPLAGLRGAALQRTGPGRDPSVWAGEGGLQASELDLPPARLCSLESQH